MDAREEMEAVRQRIDAMEAELAQLKGRVALLEGRRAPDDDSAPLPRPLAPGMWSTEKAAAATAPEAMPPPVLRDPPFDAGLPPVLPSEPWSAGVADTAAAAEPALPAPRSNTLREWLEPLQLWPPSGEEDAEVRLAAWWATRLGALLAVIGVVFLGIYVSRDASPWVRLSEVAAVTAGVLALGRWLERKLPKFGAVVFGAGLALAYFAAFAAYAVTPMKVIDSPAVATLSELVVVGGIFLVAWQRGSQVVATMAVVLGHVTAFLALRGGPPGFGPWVVMALGAVAVTLRQARNWEAPSALALPLAWLFLAAATVARPAGQGLLLGAAWFWATLYFALFLIRDGITAWRGGELSRLDRVLQVTNSTLAVAMGWFVTAQVGGARLTEFYFGAGSVMLIAGLTWGRTGAARALVPVFVCKASGLIALGVIAALDGHARSLVLLAQAFVMIVSARQSAMRGLEIASMAGGAVALGFYLGELRAENAVLWTGATLAEVAFLSGAAAFVSLFRRWLALDPVKTALGSVIVGASAVMTLLSWNTHGWSSAVAVVLGVLLAAAAALVRGWLTAALVGGMLLFAGHVLLWVTGRGASGALELWGNQAALVAGVALAAVGARRWSQAAGQRRVHGALAALACGTLVATCSKAFGAANGFAASGLLAAVLVALARRAPRWPLAELSAPLVALGAAFLLAYPLGGDVRWLWPAAVLAWAAPVWLVAQPDRLETIRDEASRQRSLWLHAVIGTIAIVAAVAENLHGPARVVALALSALAVVALAWRPGLKPALEASWALWCVVIGEAVLSEAGLTPAIGFVMCWLPALALVRPGRFGELAPVPPAWRGSAAGIQATLATTLGIVFAFDLQGPAQVGAFAAVVAVAWAAWHRGGVAPARRGVLVAAAVGWMVAWNLAGKQGAQGWGLTLATVLAGGSGVVALPFALERDLDARGRRVLRWMASLAGLALIFRVLALQRGGVADHTTVGWGVAAVAVFLAGLFGRSQPHRLAGLAGLALCVPRAFLVDLHSTLHRIAAFVALGVVLLWVGFSYHRFRHFVVDEDKKL